MADGGEGFGGRCEVVERPRGNHRLSKPDRTGGKPLNLAFCWSHGRRKLIEAKPKAGSPIVDEALVRIAALYKIEGEIRGQDPKIRSKIRGENRARWSMSSLPGWRHRQRVCRASPNLAKPWPIC
jgi:transposase